MRSSRVGALCAVAALLLFAVMSARGTSAVPGSLRDVPLERGTGGGVSSGGVTPGENAFKVDITDELRLVQYSFVIAALILLLVAFAMFVRRLQRLRRRPMRLGVGVEAPDEEVGGLEPTMQMRLRRAAQKARTELAARTGGPPGDAVITAWLRLEEAAEQEGAGREPHQTATEFTTALLARHTTSEPALDELRELYQRARFGPPGLVGEDDAAAALAALDRILHALAGRGDRRERGREMSPLRAIALAVLTAVVIQLTAMRAMDVPFWWAVLVALPPAAAVLLTALFAGKFDQDWTPEPDLPTASVCLHASQLTDRLGQAATDPYRYTSRVQPRLRRLALTALRRDPDTADIADLHDPRARERLGADLHGLLTASHARLPKPDEFAALVRRLEEL